MDLLAHFQTLARYNRVANERLFEACSKLDAAEYGKLRKGSFGSIHALLNHIMLGDRIWMARFEGAGRTTPKLNTVLYQEFSDLWDARKVEDARIEGFFAGLKKDALGRSLQYTNSLGKDCVDDMTVSISHLFNHQTHHRGQVHVMLSQTEVPPPSLDLHHIINP
jgi:uncharacterized damage-inducible protein DinB